MEDAALLPEALALLRTTPQLLHVLLSDLPSTTVERPNPEGWSIKDIVAHLHDTEDIAFMLRIRRILDEDLPFIESIDPSARLLQGGYAARSLPDVLDSLRSGRAEHIAWLATLAPALYARAGRHDRAGLITIRDIVHQWAYHDLAHTRQIMEMLQAEVVPRMGRTRAFYPEAEALFAWRR